MLVGLDPLAIKIHVRVNHALVMECVIRLVTPIGEALARPDILVVLVHKRATHLVVPPAHFHILVRGGK